jgi:hypothetical protein
MDTERIQVIPQGYENLACSYAKPAAWKTADIPPQAFDNEDPYFFLPLVAAVSPDGAGAFTVGARPAYPDGTLIQWLQHLAAHDNIVIEDIRLFEADGMRGLLFDGRQPGDTAFPSQLLSAALPIPAHWSATEDAATTTITQQPDQAIVIQIDRRPVDQTLLDTLHAAHPGANSMRNTEDGVEVLLLAGLDEPFPFRAYFVRPRPQSSEMFVVEVNFRDGFMQQAIPAARNIHLALAES